MATTDYVVFYLAAGGDTWELISRENATTADVAIRTLALRSGEGTYAAVPARSWQPRTVKVEQRASFAKDAS